MAEYKKFVSTPLRNACSATDADIYFLVSGTKTNATMIDCMLRPYEGVIAATTKENVDKLIKLL